MKFEKLVFSSCFEILLLFIFCSNIGKNKKNFICFARMYALQQSYKLFGLPNLHKGWVVQDPKLLMFNILALSA